MRYCLLNIKDFRPLMVADLILQNLLENKHFSFKLTTTNWNVFDFYICLLIKKFLQTISNFNFPFFFRLLPESCLNKTTSVKFVKTYLTTQLLKIKKTTTSFADNIVVSKRQIVEQESHTP